MGKSKIQWTEQVWNPVRGCSRVSPGCQNCYAERQAGRFCGAGAPFGLFVNRTPAGPRWTGKVELVPEMLDIPLRRKTPTTYFVNSMSDLFHEGLPDEVIDRVFAVMALCPQHTFQVLTKRAERMERYFGTVHDHGLRRFDDIRKWAALTTKAMQPEWGLPLPNVWLGVSVENQQYADERIPHLLRTPAAVRFVSYEPALGAVNYERWLRLPRLGEPIRQAWNVLLDWIIIGGESGRHARPFDVAWARQTIAQCKAAGVPCFVKQLGSVPIQNTAADWIKEAALPASFDSKIGDAFRVLSLQDSKGGNPAEWPEGLRVRETPK